jgi:hypothetical protein
MQMNNQEINGRLKSAIARTTEWAAHIDKRFRTMRKYQIQLIR